jgi:hypothetical protein
MNPEKTMWRRFASCGEGGELQAEATLVPEFESRNIFPPE